MMADSTAVYGRRLLVDVVQSRAKQNHPVPFALLAKSSDPSDGFADLSYKDLNAAVDACAWLIHDALAGTADFESFAWMGPPSDLRYIVMVLAAMKTKKKVFFPSPRNSLAAQLSLLEECQCNFFFVPKLNPPPVVDTILKERSMKTVSVPSLLDLARLDPTPYDFYGTFEDCWLDPVCTLHTSGSTGVPKAVHIKHNYWTATDALNRLPEMGLQKYAIAGLKESRNFVPMPLFHCAGLVCASSFTCFFDHTLISAPDMVLSADSVNKVFSYAAPSWAILPAATIKDLVEEPAYHDNIRKVQYISCGGAPLAPHVGTILTSLTSFVNIFGATECSAYPNMTLDAEDYNYHCFSPVLGAEFRPVGLDQYELVMVRKPEYELFQTVFGTFPERQEWETKDLWVPHPSKSNLWAYRGRLDDIIVFSNGEKLNPSTIEGTVTSLAAVKGALVFGTGHFQPGLLVEPADQSVQSGADHDRLLHSIWPALQRINEQSVAHGRIAKDLVFFTKPEKPLLRAAKGSIQRRMSIELYRDEIESLYGDEPVASTANGALRLNDVVEKLRDIIGSAVGTSGASIGYKDDFFTHGVDSLQAASIARQFNRYLGRPVLQPQNIYRLPNLSLLSEYIVNGRNHENSASRTETMQSYFEELCAELPISFRPPQPPKGKSVLLTGSTGSLGPYLVDALLKTPDVNAIFCLNRKSDAKKRQQEIHSKKDLKLDPDRVRFFTAELHEQHFGLPFDQYCQLLKQTTHIIHNAWPVNFNLTLSSFSKPLRGVRRLVDFSVQSSHGASLHFISSISAASNFGSLTNGSTMIPETLISDWNASASEGYGESKLIAENLIAKAAATNEMSGTILRVGQIAGPAELRGQWPKQEWLPSAIASSKRLGYLPRSFGPLESVSWIPIDKLATVLVELTMKDHEQGKGLQIRNVANPRPQSWSALAPAVLAYFAKAKPVEFTSFQEWTSLLQKSASQGSENPSDFGTNPAVKLAPFFENLSKLDHELPQLSTTESQKESGTLSELQPVTAGMMSSWMEQWAF